MINLQQDVPEEFAIYLSPSLAVDSDHPDVVHFAKSAIGDTDTPRDCAIALYYAVRDGIRYDPYRCTMTLDGLKASRVLQDGHGWCVNKAALLAACCRAVGISARLGFADVRNHLSTERMREMMKTDIFVYHGYTSIWLDGQWVKATPAFNLELCERFGLLPLEFDGREDSIYHPFDKIGRRHMEYIRMRGEYADIPLDEMLAEYARVYENTEFDPQADFTADVTREMDSPAT